MMTSELRANLPELPQRMRSLPIQNGYPIPWFVAQVDGGHDFRIADKSKIGVAIKKRLCWCCGQKLGAYLAFPIGPMCAINRVIAEPPSHRECAEWSMKACPFLTQRQEHRRDISLDPQYAEHLEKPPGNAIMRQPGAVCLWVTKSYSLIRDGNGVLFSLGEPTDIAWFKGGRPATRAEVLESIESGYPLLLEMARQEGDRSVRALEQAKERALQLVPTDGGDRT